MDLPERMSFTDIASLFKLEGKTALVTGAGGALGSALSRGLAVHGADVALVDLTEAPMRQVAQEIREALGRRAELFTCDVADETSVEDMVEAVVRVFGRIDILVTAAGVAKRVPMEVMPVEEWQKVQDVNVRGTFLCCQKVGRRMIAQGGGKIITIGSVRGFQGNPGGYSGYTTSKGAVHALTKQMAAEWAKYHINVNCIAPAIFWTPLTKEVLQDKALYDFHMSRIPWGRAGVPDDFIGAAVFLASAGSDFMTGAIVNVDGGWLAS
jgi:NAD(P)-dependent dehydrogenase (short-subunit alcohol dehydrogenase family)